MDQHFDTAFRVRARLFRAECAPMGRPRRVRYVSCLRRTAVRVRRLVASSAMAPRAHGGVEDARLRKHGIAGNGVCCISVI